MGTAAAGSKLRHDGAGKGLSGHTGRLFAGEPLCN
jgi:hypothetical protein